MKKTAKKEDKEICASLFKLFGDRWSLRIVDALRDDELRYREIQEVLAINSATLASRLRRLESVGVLSRKEDLIDKLSVSYALTPRGKELLPIYDSIMKFGKKVVQ